MPFVSKFVRCSVDGYTATLLEPLVYQGRDDRFEVPAGFGTDFASVPQIVTWLVPKMGSYTKAAVLHDWLCTELEHWSPRRTPFWDTLPPASARDTDGIFRRVMRESGVGFIRRWLMWTAVRWGALFNPARRPGWWKDAPLVVLITLLVGPIIAPACILDALTLAVDALVEAVVGRWAK